VKTKTSNTIVTKEVLPTNVKETLPKDRGITHKLVDNDKQKKAPRITFNKLIRTLNQNDTKELNQSQNFDKPNPDKFVQSRNITNRRKQFTKVRTSPELKTNAKIIDSNKSISNYVKEIQDTKDEGQRQVMNDAKEKNIVIKKMKENVNIPDNVKKAVEIIDTYLDPNLKEHSARIPKYISDAIKNLSTFLDSKSNKVTES